MTDNYKYTIITKSGILYTKKLQYPSDHIQDRPGQPKQIPGNAADDPAELVGTFPQL